MNATSVRSSALVAGLLAAAAACASGGSSAPSTTSTPAPAAPTASAAPAPAAAPRRSDRSHLSHDEIVATRENNMYDVISKLRPHWLASRGVASRDTTGTQVQVYLDGARQDGGVQSLRQIEPSRVTAAQRLDAADASTRFGMGNAGGAILISTQRT